MPEDPRAQSTSYHKTQKTTFQASEEPQPDNLFADEVMTDHSPSFPPTVADKRTPSAEEETVVSTMAPSHPTVWGNTQEPNQQVEARTPTDKAEHENAQPPNEIADRIAKMKEKSLRSDTVAFITVAPDTPTPHHDLANDPKSSPLANNADAGTHATTKAEPKPTATGNLEPNSPLEEMKKMKQKAVENEKGKIGDMLPEKREAELTSIGSCCFLCVVSPSSKPARVAEGGQRCRCGKPPGVSRHRIRQLLRRQIVSGLDFFLAGSAFLVADEMTFAVVGQTRSEPTLHKIGSCQ